MITQHLGDLDYPHLGADRGQLLDGQVQVKVVGKPGLPFQVVSALTGTVFGSGQIGANGSTMANVNPLSMGDIYGVKSMDDGIVHDPFLTPVKVWSTPDTLSSGFQIQPLAPTRGLVAEIGGSTDMAPSLSMARPATPPTSNQQWQAWLLVGTEQDVQPAGGGKYVLVSNLSIPGTVYWKTEWQHAVGNIPTETPTDPNLAGTVICYQWMIQEGSNLYFSDILGVMLRGSIWDPSQANQSQASGGGSSAQKSSGSTKASGKKLKKTPKPQTRRKMDPTVQASLGKWLIMKNAKPLPAKMWTKLKALARK
ncbi:MAG TPA: hypothetical protein ENK02_13390 [Planctomycetes bacterium]|nr:hypothetical protein [Planctomycetota bacterium]